MSMLRLLTATLATLFAGHAAFAQGFATQRVAAGLDRPVFVTAPPGDFERLFIVEQHTGRIRILRLATRTLENDPFLDIDGISTLDEQGLLGLAFDPDYDSNGTFYVYLTDPASRVLRFQVSSDPDVADPASQQQVLAFDQPQPNHNAGWIGFGPDGFLYVATGDGGASNDEGDGHTPDTGNAQDLSDNLLGKILRLDVGGDDFPNDTDRNYAIPPDNPFVGVAGDDEIWAYGLRNPWRASFDRQTGDLWIGDVGQNDCEEINVILSGSSGGENFGWRLREGVIQTPAAGIGGAKPPGALDPVIDYPHPGNTEPCSGPPAGVEGFSVTGGYVYRGPEPSLRGRYFFADFVAADLWSFVFDGSLPAAFDGSNYVDFANHADDPRFVPAEGSIRRISAFGEDAAGELYVLNLEDGEIFLVPEPTGWHSILAALTAVGAICGVRRRPSTVRRPAQEPG
jgi:glucose/arabinose dehydrogenase